MNTIYLKSKKDGPIRRRHPWIFAGAIDRVKGSPEPGEAIDVCDADGQWLARGLYSSESQIRVRLLSWNKDEQLDADFFRSRIQQALRLREGYLPRADNAAGRLVYSEADGLPGLIVDRYDRHLVVQLLSQGMDVRKDMIVELLVEMFSPEGIHDRSDAAMRAKEGLDAGGSTLFGAEPPEKMIVELAGEQRTWVDLRAGQKTGAFLDQARNRLRVGAYCRDADVLDAFCYTGGFAVAAGQAGAKHITAIDSSQDALDTVPANFELNGVSTPLETTQANVFEQLRLYRDQGRSFDVIVLDPPKFAYCRSQVDKALRGYKDINLQALKLLRPGGYLATFSCSGSVVAEDFQLAVSSAAVDAGRDVQVLEKLSQPPDHPILLSYPPSEYLKGLICRVW